MENRKEHYRHILLYYFRKGERAAQAHRNICAVYGKEALTERQCQKWYSTFRSGNFSLKDKPRCGRPSIVNDDEIKAMIDTNPKITTRKIAAEFNVSHTCIENRLKQLGYIKSNDFWIPPQVEKIISCSDISSPKIKKSKCGINNDT